MMTSFQSPSCERNKEVIAKVLVEAFSQCKNVLEVGSCTGQHVVHFAQLMPSITWQPMDFAEYFTGLQQNLEQRPENVLAPVELKLSAIPWLPNTQFDGLFSANTLHIMSWQHVIGFFERAGIQLKKDGILCLYGPFKYNGKFTSPSNAGFEQRLKDNDPLSGVRDFEAVIELAVANNLELQTDHSMPANNQLLVLKKSL
jgi:cyclopropane fatty-acyl-phospholipid synthase-like methyltransferase